MRLESPIQVDIRGVRIGGPRPLVCLPLMAAGREALLDQAAELVRLGPDLLEWRNDAFPTAAGGGAAADPLPELRRIIGDLPLIFTCRCPAEGGQGDLSAGERLDRIQSALASGLVDLVDAELCNSPAHLEAVRAAAAKAGARLILSHHNFATTPGQAEIVATLERAQEAGAHIAKVAVMPRTQEDLLTLVQATLAARRGAVEIPMDTIAMAHLGLISRVAGGLFGSDITFASGTAASAPGQIPIAELRRAMALFHPA